MIVLKYPKSSIIWVRIYYSIENDAMVLEVTSIKGKPLLVLLFVIGMLMSQTSPALSDPWCRTASFTGQRPETTNGCWILCIDTGTPMWCADGNGGYTVYKFTCSNYHDCDSSGSCKDLTYYEYARHWCNCYFHPLCTTWHTSFTWWDTLNIKYCDVCP